MTSPENPSQPHRPSDAAAAALYDALVTEHATIYGYGIVSAHSTPDDNHLVAQAMAAHREQRETLLGLLDKRGVVAPLTAAGYQLPIKIDDPTDAANLAVRMETDAAVAWRAVAEQSDNSDERSYAVTALTQSAVRAAQWKLILKIWPVTVPFPGGSE